METLWKISANELKQVLKDPMSLAPHFIIPLFFIGVFSLYFLTQPGEGEVASPDFLHVLVLLGVIGATTSLALCADSFAGEKERNTLELLMSLPVPHSSLFWGKVLGLIPLPILFGWLGQIGFLISTLLMGVSFPSIFDVITCFLLTLFSSILLISLCTWISLRMDTVRGAAQVSGLIAIFYLFLIQAVYLWFLEKPIWLIGILLLMGVVGVLLLLGGKARFEKGKVY